MARKLIVKENDNDGRFDFIKNHLKTSWDIISVDSNNRHNFSQELLSAEAVISMSWNSDFPDAPNLKLLQLQGAGADNVEMLSVPDGAFVCNVYEHEVSMAEYIMAGMLQWTTNIFKHDHALRKNDWYGSYLFGPPHDELHGKTLGILGFGRIGKETAHRAKSFGMKIIACSRNTEKKDKSLDALMPMAKKNELLKKSDFLLISLPLNKSTENIIDKNEFNIMKSSSVIINVSRGRLINEKAMFEACSKKEIGGAIIDTWYNYPTSKQQIISPSKFKFYQLDNVIMTPHSSAWTLDLIQRRCKEIARNLDSIYRGEKPFNILREPLNPRG